MQNRNNKVTNIDHPYRLIKHDNHNLVQGSWEQRIQDDTKKINHLDLHVFNVIVALNQHQ